MSKKIMLSAVQPTSHPTLGVYLGALKNWVRLQSEYECIFFAVDMHAITTGGTDPKELRELTYYALASYIASGIDPEKSLIFVQSHVPQHAELNWILNCYTYMGELSRMTQFKDKSAKQGKNVRTGLFTYPVLMAADILLYDTQLVPVGQDQKQHLELSRDIAQRFNHHLEQDVFVIPEPFIPPVGAKIMSLQDPGAKMSKSDPNPHATIYLTDTDKQIEKKLKKAVTDSGSEITYDDDKPGVKNLIQIQSAITQKTSEEIVASYAGKQYGHLKVDTAEIVVEAIRPIREEIARLVEEKSFLDEILEKGARLARERAEKKMEQVYRAVGFIPKK